MPPSDFSTLRVTGYGIDCDPQTGERNEDSQTEQTATGPYLSNTADRINYIIYIQPANSGSAVERECHRLVYAVHTNSGCFGSFHVLGGGTRIDHQPLQDALANPQGVCKDCNENGIDDACDIDCGVPGCISPCGGSTDCNSDGTPDECQPNIDCNSNGTQDICDIGSGTSQDCNGNTVPDECDIASARSMDCNCNGIPDECDIASGNSADTDDDCLLDECNGPCCMPDGTCVDDTAQVCCEALDGVWSFFGAEDCASLPFRCPAIFGPQPGP